MNRRAFISVVALLAAAPAFGQGVSDSQVVLGQSAAFSGPSAQLGKDMREGAMLYFDHVNAQGGVNGRRIVLKSLDERALEQLLEKAEAYEGRPLPLEPEARGALMALADGDGRYLLSLAETLFNIGSARPLGTKELGQALQKRSPAYDKDREEHYNLISALHKSIRGSDPDAALYWLARMLAGGEDPLFIARRLIRAAAEDVGEADPLSLLLANAAKETYDFLGSPEGEIALAQTVVHLATAPKSNAVYKAFGAAMAAAKETGSLMPPKHILNAPTRLMKDLGYGKGYAYDHEAEEGFSGQDYFPEEMERRRFYQPKGEGSEARIKERLERWAALRNAKSG